MKTNLKLIRLNISSGPGHQGALRRAARTMALLVCGGGLSLGAVGADLAGEPGAYLSSAEIAVAPVSYINYSRVGLLAANLFSMPLTVAQRQLVHAGNFRQLPAVERAWYLHAVAYHLGFVMQTTWTLSAETLTEYLEGASLALPEFQSDRELSAFRVLVKTAMDGLNQLISTEIAGTPTCDEAMTSGAINIYYDTPDQIKGHKGNE